jgi:hypothetical protein
MENDQERNESNPFDEELEHFLSIDESKLSEVLGVLQQLAQAINENVLTNPKKRFVYCVLEKTHFTITHGEEYSLNAHIKGQDKSDINQNYKYNLLKAIVPMDGYPCTIEVLGREIDWNGKGLNQEVNEKYRSRSELIFGLRRILQKDDMICKLKGLIKIMRTSPEK